MARVPADDPDRLEFRRTAFLGARLLGGLLMAVPFLLLGVATLFELVGEGRLARPSASDLLPGLAVILLGTVPGLVVYGLRYGTMIDWRGGRVTQWWGWLRPMSRTEYDLASFVAVSLSSELRHSRCSSHMAYSLCLRDEVGNEVEVDTVFDADVARRLAEDVSRLVGYPILDKSLGARVVRKAAEVDLSLRQRARRSGKRPRMPDPPPDRVSEHSFDGDVVTFRFRGNVVSASPRALFVERPTTSPGRPATVPAERIEELYVGSDKVEGLRVGDREFFAETEHFIVVRTDEETVGFGGGLSPEELQWMRAVIEAVVTA